MREALFRRWDPLSRSPRDFRIAGLSIIAYRGKGRGDSRLLIGPGIVHASLAHRGCPL